MHNILHKVHFVGIGGIGMSGLARLCAFKDIPFSGSTLDGRLDLLENLKQHGGKIYFSHSPDHLSDDTSCLVYSSAIAKDNPEIEKALRLGIPVLHRSKFLELLLKDYQVIAISGTHGKTTTTALLGYVLDQAGLDPLIIAGGVMPYYGSNVRLSHGPLAVVEADESDGSFLNFDTLHTAVVTNIEPEHMTFFRSVERLKQSFQEFLEKANTFRVIWGQDPVLSSLCNHLSVLTYGQGKGFDMSAENVQAQSEGLMFDVWDGDKKTPSIFLNLKGSHNVDNALAVFTVARTLNIDIKIIQKAFAEFSGIFRRLTVTGYFNEISVIDDYAHHPTEIQAVISALKHHQKGKVIAICQPHRYSRLQDLMEDFSKSLQEADEVILLPVYGAGEEPIPGIHSEVLKEKLAFHHKNVFSVPCWKLGIDRLCELLRSITQPGDVIVCCGAGDITQLAYLLPNALSL